MEMASGYLLLSQIGWTKIGNEMGIIQCLTKSRQNSRTTNQLIVVIDDERHF